MANAEELKEIKGFLPRSIKYAKEVNSDFADGLAEFYSAIWAEREDGISQKQKHLIVFSIACSNRNVKSAVKILARLKKFNATRQEIQDCMMIAAWTGGVQNFTDFTPEVLKEMDRLGF